MKVLMSRAVTIALVNALCLLTLTVAAAADTVLVYPGGSTSMSGRITVTSGFERIVCSVTLRGSLGTMISGSLTREPETRTNPVIGTLTSGSSSGCGSGTSIALLFPREPPWKLYAYSTFEGEAGLYLLHAQMLITGLFGRCLADAGLQASFRASAATITRTTILSRSVECPPEGSVTGTLTFSPETHINNQTDLRTERREEGGNPSVEFGVVVPGREATKTLIVRNISVGSAPMVVGTGLGPVGAGAALFAAEGIPAQGTALLAGNAVSITVRFRPPGTTPLGETIVADFLFRASGLEWLTPMIGWT